MKRVSLAYRDLSEIPRDFCDNHGADVEELDLSYNRISDMRPLSALSRLNTLVLDKNDLTAHVLLPSMPALHTLWVNHNQIENLSLFVETIAANCPNLRFLSMMNNAAAPSYFNKGSVQDYNDYRFYVISRLPDLEVLDDVIISADERDEAKRIYGKRRVASRAGPGESNARR